MRVLLLAPQPFYQDRGTPIAVDLMLRILSEAGHTVDVVTYHEGRDVCYPGIRIHRIAQVAALSGIRPGFSLKKLGCDLLMIGVVARLLLRNRYDLVHAVEESAFIARGLRLLLGLPYVYDMDSSLAQQMVEKHARLAFALPWLQAMERMVVRGATAVVPVCDALADAIAPCRPKHVVTLHDVSLLDRGGLPGPHPAERLTAGSPLVMYVGNLEPYQGVDLLLESFAAIVDQAGGAELVLVGGEPADIEACRQKCGKLGIAQRVQFVGQRPVEELAGWLKRADVLVSPRIKGKNTPMKVYSYLHSGRPVLATRIASHTQVLHDGVAMLADPAVEPFSAALLRLIQDARLRDELGRAGRRYAAERFSYESCRRKVRELYAWLEQTLRARPDAGKRQRGVACSFESRSLCDSRSASRQGQVIHSGGST